MLVVAAFAALPGAGWAENLSIARAVALSREGPQVRAARQRARAAEGRRDQAGLAVRSNPELSGTLADDGLFAGQGERRLGIELGQELEIAGQPGLRGWAADLELRATRAGVASFEREQVARVLQAFTELLHAQRRAELAGEVRELNDALIGISERRLAAGDISEIEHNLIVLEVERARAESEGAQAALVAARAALNGLLGRPARSPVRAAGELPASAPQLDPIFAMRPQRLDVRARRLESRARGADASLLAREVVPNPRISLGWERESAVVAPGDFQGDPGLATSLGGLRDRDDLFSVRLSFPIPLWNRNQGAVREAEARASEASWQARALEREAEAEVEARRADLGAAARRLRIFSSLLPRSERTLELLARAFSVGQIDATTLLQARDRSLRARTEHLDSQRDYALARIALARALGVDPMRTSTPEPAP